MHSLGIRRKVAIFFFFFGDLELLEGSEMLDLVSLAIV